MVVSKLPRHSGIQKQVLSLYREALRKTAPLPAPDKASARAFLRDEFRTKGARVERMDFQRIELLLRQGRRKLEYMSESGVGFGTFNKA
jgi:succinate dehydrogenase assembly factor 1